MGLLVGRNRTRVTNGDKEALREAVDALVKALGVRSSNALWEAARVNKNDWNDRLRPYLAKTTGKKQVDRLVDGLLANLRPSGEQVEVLEFHRLELYRAVGIDPRLVSTRSPGPAAEPPGAPQERPARDDVLAVLRSRVREFWIDGVLDRSIVSSPIELDMVEMPEAVEPPWDVTLPGTEPGPGLPADQITLTFRRANCELLILGPAGSGKTISLLELARDALLLAERDPGAPVPVVLMLASWSSDQGRLADWVVSELNAKYHVSRRLARSSLVAGRLVLLLDGLDELPAELRPACAESINQFRQHGFGHVHLAVTCRSDVYRSLGVQLRLSSAVAIEPLTDAQIAHSLEASGSAGEIAQTILERDAGLRELAHSPLLFGILRISAAGQPLSGGRHDDDAAAPALPLDSVRARLFDNYLAYVFRRRGQERGYSLEQVRGSLHWLASNMSAENRLLFFMGDVQPSWLPPGWAPLCTALVGATIGVCLAMPGVVLTYLLIGSAAPALTWAVTFWLIWTLRAMQRREAVPGWSSWDAVKVLAVCVSGAAMLRALQTWGSGRPVSDLVGSSIGLGLALAIAWGLTWLVRSHEVLWLHEREWWRRHWLGAVIVSLAVVIPFAWLLTPLGTPGPYLSTAFRPSTVATSVGLGLLLGLGTGAACIPLWQPDGWRVLLRPAIAGVVTCFAVVATLSMVLDPRQWNGPPAVNGGILFFALVLAAMTVIRLALRRLDAPRIGSAVWGRSDRVIAGVLFATCVLFVSNPGVIALMLAVMLALALDPSAVHPVGRLRPSWRHLAFFLLFSPLLAFFVTEAGVAAMPSINVRVSGVELTSGGFPTLAFTLAVSVAFGVVVSLIMLAAVGLVDPDEMEPDWTPRSLSRASGWARLMLAALLLIVVLLVAAEVAGALGYAGLFRPITPGVLAAVFLVTAVAAIYLTLIMGGAAVLNHGLVRFFLWRLGLVPSDLADFIDCCVEMTVLRRVGDGFLFAHSLMMDYMAGFESARAGPGD
jgi:hypothetical protein